jgi:transcriptional regulator with XRE-family HTH domain
MARGPKKDSTDFGVQVDIWRLEAKIPTRLALAKTMGMDGPVLSKILSRSAPPKPETLHRLAKALGRRPDEVFAAAGIVLRRPKSGQDGGEPPAVEELIDEIREASEDLDDLAVAAIRHTVRAVRARKRG